MYWDGERWLSEDGTPTTQALPELPRRARDWASTAVMVLALVALIVPMRGAVATTEADGPQPSASVPRAEHGGDPGIKSPGQVQPRLADGRTPPLPRRRRERDEGRGRKGDPAVHGQLDLVGWTARTRRRQRRRPDRRQAGCGGRHLGGVADAGCRPVREVLAYGWRRTGSRSSRRCPAAVQSLSTHSSSARRRMSPRYHGAARPNGRRLLGPSRRRRGRRSVHLQQRAHPRSAGRPDHGTRPAPTLGPPTDPTAGPTPRPTAPPTDDPTPGRPRHQRRGQLPRRPATDAHADAAPDRDPCADAGSHAAPDAPEARPFAAPSTSGTHNVPASIDDTGATDVYHELNDWIDSVPNGSVIMFPAEARSSSARESSSASDRNLILNGNGSTLRLTGSPGDHQSSAIKHRPVLPDQLPGRRQRPHHHQEFHDRRERFDAWHVRGRRESAGRPLLELNYIEVRDIIVRAVYGDGTFLENCNDVWVHETCTSSRLVETA